MRYGYDIFVLISPRSEKFLECRSENFEVINYKRVCTDFLEKAQTKIGERKTGQEKEM